MLEFKSDVEIKGIAEIAEALPDGDWYVLSVFFRKVDDHAEIHIPKLIAKSPIWAIP